MGIVFAYMLAFLCYIVGRHWFRGLLYGIGFLVFVTNIFLSRKFELDICPDVVQMLAETNGAESKEFLQAYVFTADFLVYPLILMALLAVAGLAEWGYDKVRKRLHGNNKLFVVVGVATCVLLVASLPDLKRYECFFENGETADVCRNMGKVMETNNDQVTRLLYVVQALRSSSKQMKEAVQKNMEALGKSEVATDDSLTVVFVIGESFIKSHAELYGYTLPTTPCMQREAKQGNLHVFTDVVSPHHSTSNTMQHMFCLNSIAANEPWVDTPYFPILFKDAGYDVAFWDIQRTCDKGAVYTFALNSFCYHPVIDSLAYTYKNQNEYKWDGDLLNDYFEHRPPRSNHEFVVFHLIGQHVLAGSRFPHIPAFERFKPADVPNRQPWMTPEKRQAVADYDNATLYNDSVMGMLFQHFRHDNAVLLYLSDHGEEVYDAHDNMGRRCDSADTASLRLQHEVPFVLWMSDVYRQRHPEVVARAQAALHRPYMTDNVGHLLLALAGIRTPYYIKERDLLSPAFCPQRRLLHGTDDYDRLCGGQ